MSQTRIDPEGADLTPLFGPLAPVEHARLLHRLSALNGALAGLAVDVSTHLGVNLFPHSLRLSHGKAGAFVYGEVGEFPVDLSVIAEMHDVPAAAPWTYFAWLSVHCELRPRGHSCLHDLYYQSGSAETPDVLIDTMEREVRALRDAVLRRDPAALLLGQHGSLPPPGR